MLREIQKKGKILKGNYKGKHTEGNMYKANLLHGKRISDAKIFRGNMNGAVM